MLTDSISICPVKDTYTILDCFLFSFKLTDNFLIVTDPGIAVVVRETFFVSQLSEIWVFIAFKSFLLSELDNARDRSKLDDSNESIAEITAATVIILRSSKNIWHRK